MSVKLWLCALETGRLNSQGVGRWASVESVSGRREKYSVDGISVQEKKSIQVTGKEIGPTAGHGRSLFEHVPSKDFVGVRTETALSSRELTG